MADTKRNLKPSPQVPFSRIEGMSKLDAPLRNVLHRMQANTARATSQARKVDDVEKRTVTAKLTSSTTVTLEHTLGKKLKSWRLKEARGGAAVYSVSSSTSKLVKIKGGVATGTSATVELEVY